jgi:hypothetical protein
MKKPKRKRYSASVRKMVAEAYKLAEALKKKGWTKKGFCCCHKGECSNRQPEMTD